MWSRNTLLRQRRRTRQGVRTTSGPTDRDERLDVQPIEKARPSSRIVGPGRRRLRAPIVRQAPCRVRVGRRFRRAADGRPQPSAYATGIPHVGIRGQVILQAELGLSFRGCNAPVSRGKKCTGGVYGQWAPPAPAVERQPTEFGAVALDEFRLVSVQPTQGRQLANAAISHLPSSSRLGFGRDWWQQRFRALITRHQPIRGYRP